MQIGPHPHAPVVDLQLATSPGTAHRQEEPEAGHVETLLVPALEGLGELGLVDPLQLLPGHDVSGQPQVLESMFVSCFPLSTPAPSRPVTGAPRGAEPMPETGAGTATADPETACTDPDGVRIRAGTAGSPGP